MNLRPPGPKGEKDESHGVSEGGSSSQPVETIQEQQAPTQDPVAESASVETQFGAPVVRELPPDPGPHEFLITVRAVAARLGLARPRSTNCASGASCTASASAVLSGSIQLPSTSTLVAHGYSSPSSGQYFVSR